MERGKTVLSFRARREDEESACLPPLDSSTYFYDVNSASCLLQRRQSSCVKIGKEFGASSFALTERLLLSSHSSSSVSGEEVEPRALPSEPHPSTTSSSSHHH
ncbi:uncharacterized protein LOC144037649 [Vanacampus margaritifer]